MEETLSQNDRRMAEMRQDLIEGISIHCHYCLRPFEAHSLNARYCSVKCRNLASQERRAEERLMERKEG